MADPELAAKKRIKRGLAKRAARQRKISQYTSSKGRPIRLMSAGRSGAAAGTRHPNDMDDDV